MMTMSASNQNPRRSRKYVKRQEQIVPLNPLRRNLVKMKTHFNAVELRIDRPMMPV